MSSSLIRKSLTYLVGTAGTRLINVLLIPLYAFFVTPSELGEFDYIQTIGGLATAVIFVASWESIIRFAMAKNAQWHPREVSRATLMIGLTGSLVAAVTATVCSILFPETAKVFVAAAVVAVLTGLLNVWQYAARADGKPRLFVASGLVNAAVNLVGIIVLVCVLHLGALGLLISYSLGLAVAITVIEADLRLLRPSDWTRPSREVMKAILRFTTPMMLDFLAAFLSLAFGRILITSVLGAAENGQFAFALKVGTTVGTVAQVLTMAALEETVLRAHTKNVGTYLSHLTTAAWLVLMTGASLLVLVARFVWEFLGETGYADSFYLVPILALASSFAAIGSIYGNSFQIGKKTSFLFYTTVVSTIIIVIGSTTTIRFLGPLGVAISMAGGTAVLLSLRRMLACRIIRFREHPIALVAVVLFIASWVVVAAPFSAAALITGSVACAALAGVLGWRAVLMLRQISMT